MPTYKCQWTRGGSEPVCGATMEAEGKMGPTFLGTCPEEGHLAVFRVSRS